MGKKSRLKKERKESGSVYQNASGLNGMLQKLSRDSKFGDGNGGVLMVLNGMGGVMGPDEARVDYWAQVGEAIRGDNPAQLPAMAHLGRLMGFSIFDVQLPIFEIGFEDEDQEWTTILLALFMMDYVECFRWIYTKLMEGCDEIPSDADQALSTLLGWFVMDSASFATGSAKERMTSLVMRNIIERDWKGPRTLTSGEPALMAIPMFIMELTEFKAKIAAASERRELELALSISNSGFLLTGEASAEGALRPLAKPGSCRVEGPRL